MVRKESIPYIVYLMGMIPLGLFYEDLKQELEFIWLFIIIASYLLSLRLIGYLLVKVPEMIKESEIKKHNAKIDAQKKHNKCKQQDC